MKLNLKRCNCGGIPEATIQMELPLLWEEAVITCNECGKETRSKRDWDKSLVKAFRRAEKQWNTMILAEREQNEQTVSNT